MWQSHGSRFTAHRSPFTVHRSLKRQSYGEMESEVALEVGINDGIMTLRILISWIYGLHAGIQTEKEIIEV